MPIRDRFITATLRVSFQVCSVVILTALFILSSQFSKVIKIPEQVKSEYLFRNDSREVDFPKRLPEKTRYFKLFQNSGSEYELEINNILKDLKKAPESDHFAIEALNKRLARLSRKRPFAFSETAKKALENPETYSMKSLFFILNSFSRNTPKSSEIMISFLEKRKINIKKKFKHTKIFYFPKARMDILRIQLTSLLTRDHIKKDSLTSLQTKMLKKALSHIIKKEKNLALVREAIVALNEMPGTRKLINKLAESRKKSELSLFQGLL